MSKRVVFVDLDHVLADYSTGFHQYETRFPELKFPQQEPGMYMSLKPLDGAINAYKWLDDNFDTYILSAPSSMNPHSYTEKFLWVQKYLGYGAAERMILSNYKNLCTGDFLIDDYEDGKGQEQFSGQLILFGSAGYPDWSAVIDYLRQIE